jgi:DNA-binding protein H-NS
MKNIEDQIKTIEEKIQKLEKQKSEIEVKLKVERNNLAQLRTQADAEAMGDIRKMMQGSGITMDELKVLLRDMEERKRKEQKEQTGQISTDNTNTSASYLENAG